MNGTKFSCGSERPLALTMPAVTVFSKHDRQAARLDLDQRHVSALVGADHLRLVLALVRELDVDLVGRVDDVRVGEDVAVGADDEARAQRAALGARARTGLLPRNEPAEELQHLLVLDVRDLRHARPARRLRRADVDDRGALLLDQPGEIG
jgi:hypothetical protein